MVFSLCYLCIADQHAQGENISHQHQGEYDDSQAAVGHDNGKFYLHSQYVS